LYFISMIKEIFIKILRIRILQHLAFWLLSFVVLLKLFVSANEITKIDIIYTIIFHISLLTGVYLNILVLIPVFLRKGRYLFYIGLLAVTIFSTACFNDFTFNRLVDIVLPDYYFISFYELTDILLFIIIYIAITTLLKLSKAWFVIMETNQKLLQAEQEKISTELKVLRTQINPHFLFNSLNSIYSLALQKAKKTPEIILLLSDLMRYMLYESNEEQVGLAKEINFVKNYLELQKLRMDIKSVVEFNIVGNIKSQKIAPLLFLPFVENSFKHGIKGEVSGGYVRINMNIMDHSLMFNIKNNKGIVDEVEKDDYKGIGLQNVKRRLELLYPDNHELYIEEQDENFTVNLKLFEI